MSRLRVLVVGSGAREHALAWKLRQSADVGDLFVAPGNAGTASVAENVPVAVSDVKGIVRLVEERDIGLTVVGPEAPLALGLADALREQGRRVVGPGAAAARIESSKAFAKRVMTRAGVPTAHYAVFEHPDDALRYLTGREYPMVIKADGLAAGKGVSICADLEEARRVLELMMVDRIYGSAGNRVVIEEALSGPEVSLIALVDGERVVPLPVAQDHKRLGDGDTGPNTGGMGAYAPVPFLSTVERNELTRTVLEPVVATLAEMGTPYQGILFAGLMLTEAGPSVLEFNCRFGDPEAQVILPLLDADLLPWLEMVADGAGPPVHHGEMPVSAQSAVGVVLAAAGYPERPEMGARVEGLEALSSTQEAGTTLAFHAGTARDVDGHVVVAGGRVITLVGLGRTIEEAAGRAYAAPVRFEGMRFRRDIAWQARDHRPLLTDTRGEGDDPPFLYSPFPSTAGAPPRRAAGEKGRPRIAILASGEGSNLQALLDASSRGEMDAEVVLVVSHREGARALERARDAGIPVYTLPLADRRDPALRCLHEEQLLDLLQSYELDLVVLAGWMLVLSAHFLSRCPWPLINVHPALLPLGGERADHVLVHEGSEVPVLRGAHAVRDALAIHVPFTGVSIHHVTPDVDAGPVVLQEVVPIEPDDDEESLYRRIKAVEHRLLPQAVQVVLESLVVGGVYA